MSPDDGTPQREVAEPGAVAAVPPVPIPTVHELWPATRLLGQARSPRVHHGGCQVRAAKRAAESRLVHRSRGAQVRSGR